MKKKQNTVNLQNNKSLWIRIKRNKYIYLMLLPGIIFTTIFCYAQYFGLVLAFNDFHIFKGVWGSPWVGLDNFKRIFTTPNFTQGIINTVKYSIIIIFIGFPLPIILALAFNELRSMKFKKVTQTISYMPYFLSWATVTGIVYGLFARDGMVNDILKLIQGEAYVPNRVMYESQYFGYLLFFSNQWKNIGWASILYLAAITGIDQQLYEAASIDGCNKLQKIWHITFPGIRTVVVLQLILNTGNLFGSNFEQVFGLQNLYIQEATDNMGTLMYRWGIQGGEYSLSTALGMVQGLASLIMVILANRISKKVSGLAIW